MLKHWQLKDFDVGEGLKAGADRDQATTGWIDVTVPGDTHVALTAAKRIADPFKGRHEWDAAWISKREWWWRTHFDADLAQTDERVELVFEGLDTFSTIYLNGEVIGQTDNMFRTYRYDISARLHRNGPNILAIAFAPTEQSVTTRPLANWGAMSERLAVSKRNFMRKAQFGWGWDWGPDLPTIGIWQPAYIERHVHGRIKDFHFSTTAITDQQAQVRIDIDTDRFGNTKGMRAQITLLNPDGEIHATKTFLVDEQQNVMMTVVKPQLWWTADLGNQPLYTVIVRLLLGDAVLDERRQQVGIRTIALDTSSDVDEPGTNFFRFVLNGVPIFARGANWIPATSFVGAVDEARYSDLLEQAVKANMNMMRVWGGGVYEHDCFYELCNRLGLLVWQDFMFACAPYPEDEPTFVENIRLEIHDQVRRLRNHPSLALWCGNNECQLLHSFISHLTKTEGVLQGSLYYDQVMPAALAELDPATPYWPGSPAGGPSANSMRGGDVHNWTVWHGIPLVPDKEFVGEVDRSPKGIAYTRYTEDMSRFVSEFGIHSAPQLATLQRWMDPQDLALGTQGFLDRIKDDPKDKINGMLVSTTGLAETLEQYVDFTMLTQAEGLKFGIEHYRRRKPHCSGTLIWQYNDCWPCVSWSLLDYDGVGKASFYATARAYAPVLASFKPLDDGSVELWITNDTLDPVAGTAVVELLRLSTGSDWDTSVQFGVPANGSVSVWRGKVPTGACDRVLSVRSPNGQFLPNRHLLAPVKDLALLPSAKPQLRIEKKSAHELEIILTAEAYLLFTHLGSDRPGMRFSDNYFDLRPSETRTIIASEPGAKLTLDCITIRCWNSEHIT